MKSIRTAVRVVMVLGLTLGIYGFLQLPTFFDQFTSKKSINLLAWPNIIDADYIQKFEKKTGIKVYLSYFENYEELIVKMGSGTGDYDLVMASDYVVGPLLKEGVVKRLDKSKLSFLKNIYSALLGLYFDKDNMYSIPYAWEVYGLGIDMAYFNHQLPEPSWNLLFNSKIGPSRIGMLDDAKENISLAALYLYGRDKEHLTSEELKEIEKLLLEQKERVVMYTDLRTDYLLITQTAPVVVGISSDIFNSMRKYKDIRFLLPKEGSFVVIDNFMLPISTKKDDLVYEFLNYLYQPKVVKRYADRYNFFPALKGVATDKDRYLLSPSHTLFSRLRYFSYNIPEAQMRDMWITLKS